MEIGLVLFDCDGVLVDSEMLGSVIFSAHLTEHGYPCTPEQARARFTGWSLRNAKKFVEQQLGRPLPDDFLDTLAEKDRVVMEEHLKPIPGIHEAVRAIDRPKCVASSGGPGKIRHSLALCGLTDLFEPHIFSAWQVANGKPSPELFQFAAQGMGTAPSACVVVEDSIAGVQAGIAAGMTVLGFCGGAHCGPGHDDILTAEGAVRTFNEMAALPQILDTL